MQQPEATPGAAPPPGPGAATARLYHLDAFRVAMLLLGIPYHSFLVFQEHSDWMISATLRSPALDVAVDLIHSFRMFAFFMISGFFSSFVLARRTPRPWLADRVRRLAVPLVFGVVVLGLAERIAVAAHRFRTGTRFTTLPDAIAGTLAGSSPGSWISHRWFLIDLLIYTALLAAVFAPLASSGPGRRWREGDRDPGARSGRSARLPLALIGAGLAAYGLVCALPFQVLPRSIGGGLIRLDWLLMYAAPFLTGALLGLNPRSLAAITARPWPLVAAAIVLTAIVLTLGDTTGVAAKTLYRMALLTSGLFSSLALIAVAERVVRTGHPVIATLVDAAFLIYLSHVIFILVICQPMIAWTVHPVAAALVTAAGSLGGSLLLYYAVRGSRVLAYCFNGAPFRLGAAGAAAAMSPGGTKRDAGPTASS